MKKEEREGFKIGLKRVCQIQNEVSPRAVSLTRDKGGFMVSVTSWFVSNQPAQSRQALKQPTSKEKYFLPTVYTEKSQDA